jgi:D-serine deaminase-like pyridoxal phosphate-dependent protein
MAALRILHRPFPVNVMQSWYTISNIENIPSPALAVYPERIRSNIGRAIAVAGDPSRLRPHIKTHKCGAIIRIHLDLGITKFKCATIAEAEMAAAAGARDILLAYPIFGPALRRFEQLRELFPQTRFSVVCDNRQNVAALHAHSFNEPLPVYLDLDCGMARTGISPAEGVQLYEEILSRPNLHAAGIHAYDGHIHDADLAVRKKQFAQVNQTILDFRNALTSRGLLVPKLIAGGTPTFALHAREQDRECSPGTYVFWDFGYQRFTDLDFQLAALVITRVISKPTSNRLCLDLGYKSIASENPPPRVQFLNLPDATPVMHSEEHLVLETPDAANWKVGDVLYGVPRHICPTVALHDFCYPVENNLVVDPWPIEARRRKITV